MKARASNSNGSGLPPYRRIFEAVETEILSGRIAPGQRLPAVRHLAEKFSVNPNTAQRAFTELKREGLILGERGLGSFVTNDAELIQLHKEMRIQKLIEELQIQLQALGFSTSEILTMLQCERSNIV